MKELTSIERDTPWKISLVRVENGWIFEYWEEVEDGERRKTERVFEDRDGEHGGKFSLVDVLHEIVEYFGQGGSKHDARRITIRYSKKWDEDEEDVS